MTKTVAVLGAGGKMGFRVTRKIRDAGYDLRAVEIGEAGRERLRGAGIEAMDRDAALKGAQAVVLAIPDSAIGAVSQEIVPQLDPGTIVIVLDAAAPYAGALPQRDDITYIIGHPCHPPLYAHDIDDPDQRRDVHGGVAPQSIVVALMQGPEEHYAVGAAICEAMWSPIIRTHRVTLEQLAILEPGLSEMVAMAFIDTMVEAMDECVEKYGIPREAAFDFLIGHINVETSMWFGFTPKVPSDAALRLMRFAKGVVLAPNWREALSPAKVKEASELIARGVKPAVSTAAFDGHPLEVALDELAALAVATVEPAYIKGYVDFDENAFSDDSAASLSRLIAGRGLSAQGVSAHMDLSLPDAEAMLARRIRFAGALGARILITNAGPASARDAILMHLDRALPRLDAEGVTLALENPGHGTGDLIGQGEEGAELIRRLGAPQVRLNIDVGNLLTYAGGVEPGLSAALPFAAHAHLKDIAAAGPDWRFVTLGDGLVDWASAADRMRVLAPALPLAIELPLRLRRPNRGAPVRVPEPLPLPAIREAIRSSLGVWERATTE